MGIESRVFHGGSSRGNDIGLKSTVEAGKCQSDETLREVEYELLRGQRWVGSTNLNLFILDGGILR